jgi:hypothetical protein
MALETYRRVIEHLITENAGRLPAEITDEILRGVKMAMLISGDIDLAPASRAPQPVQAAPITPVPRGGTLTPAPSRILTAESEFGSQAMIIGEAPPTVSDSESNLPGDYYTVDELRDLLQSSLPSSMKVKLPNVDQPVELILRLSVPPFEMQRPIKGPSGAWVKIRYVVKGQMRFKSRENSDDEFDLCPEVVIQTSQKDVDCEAIKRDIVSQASKMFTQKPVRVEARVTAPVAVSIEDFESAQRSGVPGAVTDKTFTQENQDDARYIHQKINAGTL